MSESYMEIVTPDGTVRESGSLSYPQATPANVLTVQDDGTIAAATPSAGLTVDSGDFHGVTDVLGGDSSLQFGETQVVAIGNQLARESTETQGAPPRTVAAMGVVCTFQTWHVESLDTTPGTYTLTVTIYVTNLDGSETVKLVGTASTAGGGPNDQATVAAADLNIDSQVGTDLTYDTLTGDVASTAGGSYGVVVVYDGQWAVG